MPEYFNIMQKAFRIIKLLCLTSIIFAAGGCMSARTTTSLKPEVNPDLKSPAGKFYVEGIKYTTDIVRQSSPDSKRQDADGQIKAYEEKFCKNVLPLVRKECITRYPALFTDSSSSAAAIPLWVDVNHITVTNDSRSITWMLCTVMICGIILPCPGDSDETIEIKTGVWDGREGIRGAAVPNSFKRFSEFWVSILPTALIPISGESDFPKISGTVFEIESQMAAYELITAQQIATAIAKSVADKKSDYWAVAPQQQKIAVQQALPEAVAPAKTAADPF